MDKGTQTVRVNLGALLCGVAMLTCNGVVAAAERVALVIGNSTYRHTSVLSNPGNDVRDMAAALRAIGFVVDPPLIDASKAQMEAALAAFAGRAAGADQALVYYAGHGAEANGENYLLPVEAQLRSERTVSLEAVKLRDVMAVVSGARELGLVVLDACRNNPLASRMSRNDPTRSASRGLAPVEPGGNLLVAYAAEAGSLASDGNGRNSPFTAAVLQALQAEPMEVRVFWGHVRDAVQASTGGEQKPFTYGTLGGKPIYLAGKSILQRPAEGIPADQGEVRIDVSPAQAQVWVDGVLLGSGFRTVRESAGKVVLIRAEADGHEVAEERVRVQSGQVADVRLRLARMAGEYSSTEINETGTPSKLDHQFRDCPHCLALAMEHAPSSVPSAEQIGEKAKAVPDLTNGGCESGYPRHFGSISAVSSEIEGYVSYKGKCSLMARSVGDFVEYELPTGDFTSAFNVRFYYFTGVRDGGLADVFQALDQNSPLVRMLHDGSKIFFWVNGSDVMRGVAVKKNRWYGIRFQWKSGAGDGGMKIEVLDTVSEEEVAVITFGELSNSGEVLTKFRFGLIAGIGNGKVFFDDFDVTKTSLPPWL